jgi:protocatechuate 3,4-dioxygenase, alpha subunit
VSEPARPTAQQTVGPFFHIGLPWERGGELVSPTHPDAIRVVGTVRDGDGEPVPDALIELWQPAEEAFGRCPTDADGGFEFVTVKPEAVPGPDGRPQARHIAVSVFARGLLCRLATRIYFPDEQQANAADPVLAAIGDEQLRSTLVARDEPEGRLRFDIRLQGEGDGGQGETAFLDV